HAHDMTRGRNRPITHERATPDHPERDLTPSQNGETAAYPFTDLDELVHAYALTVHRSQGSEYPYVVIPMINAAGTMLLQRNLLYTAVTRARHGVMLIGQSEAVERAVANNRTQRRSTALSHRITHTEPVVSAPRPQAPNGQMAWG
ncbi:ATP-dependent RecD-like DNA helicase, partial [Streptomyces massasporeus]|uniref:ATP-dependent RecD-like DNA helicase n=1 Tax=Streptomyces massasporeus TaxID=67324 RepID=UPI0033FE19DE